MDGIKRKQNEEILPRTATNGVACAEGFSPSRRQVYTLDKLLHGYRVLVVE